MKISESWLREWVNPPVETQELAEQLTLAGLEVESVEPAASAFDKVVVGEVLSVERHPDADKLSVCRVNTGEGEEQIVCGAPNVRVGMKAPTALVGGVLPGDLKIRKAKLRGVESKGMLCSEPELGLGEDAEGLMVLPADAPVGMDLREYMKLDDAVIELELTPNRGDCLGVIGVAREVSAINSVSVANVAAPDVEAKIDDTFPVEVKAPEDCPVYVGRVIRGVNLEAETPVWMRERLRRGGIRPLHPVVDVTNYVMLELGQPMHGFDLDRLNGGIVVRRAKKGEKMTLLDGTEITLDPEVLVIADHKGPVAMAGIMGGEGSGVEDATRDVFLESAFFSPLTIAGRARRFGLHTDSSHRFERGVDPALQTRAVERATKLLTGIAGGRPGPVTAEVSEKHLPQRREVRLRKSRLAGALGIEVPDARVTDILERLEMDVTADADGWTVMPPSHRFDIAIEEDLIEEVGRIHGYDQVPAEPLAAAVRPGDRPEHEVALARLRDALVQRGYQEAITYSFVDPAVHRAMFPEGEALPLENPIASDLAEMRLSTWPGLVGAMQHNLNRQQERVRLFETGLKFVPQGSDLEQKKVLGGAVIGPVYEEQWGLERSDAEFADVKGDVEAVLATAGREGDFAFRRGEHAALHPGQTAEILDGDRPIGRLGRIHPAVARKLDLPDTVYLFEMELETVQKGLVPSYRPISRFPAIRRDLAVVVEEAVEAGALVEAAREAAGALATDVRVFDIYRGKGIDSGRKSVALSLILQDSSRTLTDEAVDAVMGEVATRLRKELKATVRE